MDDDFGADESLLAAMAAAADPSPPAPPPAAAQTTAIRQPVPQRTEPLDRAPPAASPAARVVQPKPQVLPQRNSGSTILVSPRQRGNPVLTCLRSMPWEYSDIPADYVLGLATCALFLSLKYHRLHPEYIYTRIRNLQGRYNLRILLTMVDIPNHEDSLRELSKTSVVNNVTIILCWSAAEAARYLELYKSYENADFTAIRGQQSSTYADRLVDFVTVPRSLNKSDAVALVANFGSLRNAVNAEPEQLSMLNGWDVVKVRRWCTAVDEPFRVKKAARRTAQPPGERTRADSSRGADAQERPSSLESRGPTSLSDQGRQDESVPKQFAFMDNDDDDDDMDEHALGAAAAESQEPDASRDQGRAAPDHSATASEERLRGGVAEALARLRELG
ncbi:hypothetical protein CDD83_6893 [Cordyceps sp. RAO-2017]|nr:hypothetical protein CDD83_6893 [Cordyceps sp. RAO-2017]